MDPVHAGHAADPRHELEQVGVAGADDLHEHVESPAGECLVDDLVDPGDRLADRPGRAVGDDAEHRHARVAEHQRVGDRDDVDHAVRDEPLCAVAHLVVGDAELRRDGGEGDPAVLLETLDDAAVDRVQLVARGAFLGYRHRTHRTPHV